VLGKSNWLGSSCFEGATTQRGGGRQLLGMLSYLGGTIARNRSAGGKISYLPLLRLNITGTKPGRKTAGSRFGQVA
jgi:hypothetical protein